jgi:hypothetical protein
MRAECGRRRKRLPRSPRPHPETGSEKPEVMQTRSKLKKGGAEKKREAAVVLEEQLD